MSEEELRVREVRRGSASSCAAAVRHLREYADATGQMKWLSEQHKRCLLVFLMVARRLGVPKEVAQMICRFEVGEVCENLLQLQDVSVSSGHESVVITEEPVGDLHMAALNEEGFGEEMTLRIADGVMAALRFLHTRGIRHGEVDAENIYISLDACTVKLGWTALPQEEYDPRGPVVPGNAYLISPERVNLGSHPSLACDIWALGLTLITLATGRHPFHDVHPMRVLYLVGSKDQPPPALHPEDFPTLAPLVQQCLEKEPSKRLKLH